MKQRFLLLNEEDGTTSTGGAGDSGQESQTNDKTTETAGDEFSAEDMYDEEAPEGTQDPNKPTEDKPASTEEVKKEKTSTGYEDDPAPTEEVAVEDKPTEEKPAEEIKLDFDLDFTGLEKDEVADLKKFIKDNNVPEATAKALLVQEKLKIQAMDNVVKKQQEDAKAKLAAQRADWKKQLKEHNDFGGKNFDHSVKIVDDFMTNHTPSIKKYLTDYGGMLPPNVMLDFFKLAKSMKETDKFVAGNTTGADDMDPIEHFYSDKE